MSSTGGPAVICMAKSKRNPTPIDFTADVWTTEEVAQYLKVSEDLVRLEARRGTMPGAFQVGTLWRFHSDQVRGYGRKGRETAEAA